MSQAPKTVLSDSGPLILLAKLHRLELLGKVFGQVSIPKVVFDEVVTHGFAGGHADAHLIKRFWQQHDWPIEEVSETELESWRPAVTLGAGELHVLALARNRPGSLVLLDDELARAEARRLGLSVKGTLGALVAAYRVSCFDFEELELILEEIEARPDFWISPRLCREVLAALRAEAAQAASS
ncbi:MAG: hypothetical protein HC897_13115 [Thermoanaerobaculia bacterium]|nr:hypothetical protein [Thermoanaerobaculia bacterium]